MSKGFGQPSDYVDMMFRAKRYREHCLRMLKNDHLVDDRIALTNNHTISLINRQNIRKQRVKYEANLIKNVIEYDENRKKPKLMKNSQKNLSNFKNFSTECFLSNKDGCLDRIPTLTFIERTQNQQHSNHTMKMIFNHEIPRSREEMQSIIKENSFTISPPSHTKINTARRTYNNTKQRPCPILNEVDVYKTLVSQFQDQQAISDNVLKRNRS